jgi:hypothetical protein
MDPQGRKIKTTNRDEAFFIKGRMSTRKIKKRLATGGIIKYFGSL